MGASRRLVRRFWQGGVVVWALLLATEAAGGWIRFYGVTLGEGVSERIEAVMVPVQVEIGLRLPEIFEKPLRETPIRVEWLLEAWVAPIVGQRNTVEAGVNPVGLRVAFDGGQSLVPFVDLSGGIMVTGLRQVGTGGGFQFSESVRAGFQWFVTAETAVSLSYQYRHMSNARIYDQNAGLDTHYALLGFHWFPDRVAK